MWQKLRLRWRSLFRAAIVETELDDEVRFHVEQQTAEFVRQGMAATDAARLARRKFGNATLHKEQCRDARKFAWLENAAQDVRHSSRSLRRSPGFSFITVLILAIGIGGTAAMFSVMEHTVLHPVTLRDAERVVWLQEISKGHEESGSNPSRLKDWQTARSFSAVGGMYGENLVWASPEGPVALSVLRLFGDMSGVLEPDLPVGRGFTAAEMRGEGQLVAVLTARCFRQRFHSDRSVLGKPLRLGGAEYEVVGVLGAAVDFPEEVDIWTPAYTQFPSRAAGFLDLMARLSPGASVEQAQAEVNLVAARLSREYPTSDGGRSVRLTPLPEYIGNAARKSVFLLLGSVGSIFLIGCFNIAGLLLARGLTRRREAAIRVSLGAGYVRLARLFFTESLLLSLGGCLGGLALAFAGMDLLKASLPAYVPNLAAVGMDGKVACVAVGLSFLAALLFGGLPAWQFARGAQTTALKEGGAGSSGVAKSRLRGALIVAQVALSFVLLVTAALLSNSFLKVLNRSLGFNAAQVYTFRVDLPWDAKASTIESLSSRVLERLNAFPGTIAAGVVDRIPLHGGSQSGSFLVRGKTLAADLAEKEFRLRTASAGSFAVLGIPLRAGEIYRDAGAQEAVISDRLAAVLFPHENPIGREIAQRVRGSKTTEPEWFRIVGVVGSMPFLQTDHEPEPEVYIPWGATYWPMMNFVVRTERPVSDVSRYVRTEIQKLDSNQIFSPVSALDVRIAETRAAPRTAAFLLSGFAFVALVLSAMGIFGLMSQEASRRTREIGVRLALGAQPKRIFGDSILGALRLVGAGLMLGICGAWFASELVQNLLFDVGPHDAGSHAVAGLVLLVAGGLASLGPAMRTARVDPVRALRCE